MLPIRCLAPLDEAAVSQASALRALLAEDHGRIRVMKPTIRICRVAVAGAAHPDANQTGVVSGGHPWLYPYRDGDCQTVGL